MTGEAGSAPGETLVVPPADDSHPLASKDEAVAADGRRGPAHSASRRSGGGRGWSRAADATVPVLFMASGAAGLIYQVVWTRELVLVFGNTTQAIVTTVTAFLGGLGIGALIGAWIGQKLRRPLAVYGCLEIAVGCVALFMPLAFDAVATIFRNAYLSLPAGEVAFIRFLLAFVALAPVTIIMGMTLPVLTRHLVRRDPDIGGRIARLYGLNTAGAVVGTLASGYVLIGVLGLRATTYVAVALNACAGIGALIISRTHAGAAGVESAAAPETSGAAVTEGAGTGEVAVAGVAAAADGSAEAGGPGEASAPVRRRLTARQVILLGVTFMSGLVSLALEILWTRVLIQETGSSIYIFCAILAAFLSGIAVGSLLYEQDKSNQRASQIATLGACYTAAGVLALLPVLISNQTGPHGLPVTVTLIFPVTLILGYAFPLTVRLFVDHAAGASRGVGVVYASNTAGCVVGAVTAGFLLVPTLGANISVGVLCITQAAIGVLLVIGFAPRRRIGLGAVGALVVAALVALLYAPALRLTVVQVGIDKWHLPVAHYEDNIASVDVVGGNPDQRRLFVNGIGITRLTIDTKLLVYLPKAVRPNATSDLNICFGMGSTYRSSIILGMKTDAVELDPTVPTVMPWFYSDAEKYLHSPLGHIIIGDGRNYVRLSNKRYDMITIDAPPPVWSAGSVVLMTHEFYQEAAQRLEPGGVMAAFLPYTKVSEMKLFIRTFHATFPYVTVVRGLVPFGYVMMGSSSPMVFTNANVERIFGTPAAQADLANAPDWPREPVSAWPALIREQTMAVNNQVNAFTGPGPLLTDDHPVSEYYLIN